MSINLSYIKPKHSLHKAEHNNVLRKSIVAKIQLIDNYTALKFDNELLIFLCSCIENSLEYKQDKKELALEILGHLFELSSDDKEILSVSIDFLCNNKLVKKIPRITKYALMFGDFVMNKL